MLFNARQCFSILIIFCLMRFRWSSMILCFPYFSIVFQLFCHAFRCFPKLFNACSKLFHRCSMLCIIFRSCFFCLLMPLNAFQYFSMLYDGFQRFFFDFKWFFWWFAMLPNALFFALLSFSDAFQWFSIICDLNLSVHGGEEEALENICWRRWKILNHLSV